MRLKSVFRIAVLSVAAGLVGASQPAQAQLLGPPQQQPPQQSAPPPPAVVDPGPLGTETTHMFGDAARRGAIAGGGLHAPLRSLWRRDFDAQVSAAVVGGGRAYVFSGGRVSALELGTGRTLWTSAAQVGGALAYGGGKVVTAGESQVIALDAATGAVAWSARNDTIGSSPLIAGDLVVLQAQGLTAYDLATGAVRWRGGTTDGTDGEPAAAGDRIYEYGGCTAAAADRRTGGLIWTRNSGCTGGGGGRVTLQGGAVHSPFGSVPLAAADGHDLAAPRLDIVADGVGLQRNTDGGLGAVDLASGTLLWSAKKDESVINDTLGAPLAVGQSVFQARFEGTLESRALRTGAVGWRAKLRTARSTFTGSSSDEDFSQAGGDGVLLVLRGSTVDGLGNAAAPPASLAITTPKLSRRLLAFGQRPTIRATASGDLRPERVALQVDPYPFGRFESTTRTAIPQPSGAASIRYPLDRNVRVRLVGSYGSAAATKAYTIYAYPSIRFRYRVGRRRVRAKVSATGSRAVRFRKRRVYLYLGRARKNHVSRLGSARLSGPRRGSGRAVIRFRRPRKLGRRDYILACIPRVERLGQGAPDVVQRRCGRRTIRF